MYYEESESRRQPSTTNCLETDLGNKIIFTELLFQKRKHYLIYRRSANFHFVVVLFLLYYEVISNTQTL